MSNPGQIAGFLILGSLASIYFLVVLIILYKSYVFFDQLEDSIVVNNQRGNVDGLKKLYLTAFIVQIILLSIAFLVGMGAAIYSS